MAGVETLEDADRCIEPLQTLGSNYVPEFEESIPHRRYFRKMESGNHTHHFIWSREGDSTLYLV